MIHDGLLYLACIALTSAVIAGEVHLLIAHADLAAAATGALVLAVLP